MPQTLSNSNIYPVDGRPDTSLSIGFFNLLKGSTHSSFWISFDTDGGFSGTDGWTPSIASQWPKLIY